MDTRNSEPKINRRIALLHGPDRPGLVAAVAGWITERGGNILHADQHLERDMGLFVQRVEWIAPAGCCDEAEFARFASASLGMNVKVARHGEKMRVGVLVSHIPHCFHDLVMRWREGELPCELVVVISNHQTLAPFCAMMGLPFHHVPVTRDSKPVAEARQLAILRESGVQLVVMARYMQILSEDFLRKLAVPVINIHHSFLPAFAGARPYHQAHERGVKIIGATAHYATGDLDEGPIIAQDVAHVSHRDEVSDLIRKGRDLEKVVFARAILAHLEHRVLAVGNKTVVFE